MRLADYVHLEREDDRRRRSAGGRPPRADVVATAGVGAANLTPPAMSTYSHVGGLYVDHIRTQVESYPEEDTPAIRAVPVLAGRQRGDVGGRALAAARRKHAARRSRSSSGEDRRARARRIRRLRLALCARFKRPARRVAARGTVDGVGQPAAFATVSRLVTGRRARSSSAAQRRVPSTTRAHFVRALPALLADREKARSASHFRRAARELAAMASALRTRAAAASRTRGARSRWSAGGGAARCCRCSSAPTSSFSAARCRRGASGAGKAVAAERARRPATARPPA